MNLQLSFCVVIPMYNEEASAEKCVTAVYQTLETLPYRTVLIVVNDGSTDATGDILRLLAPEYEKLNVLTHEKNAGYGSALRTGTKRAADDGSYYVLFMDSGLTNDPKDIPKFAAKMLEGHDMIKASRYVKGSRVQEVPAYRVVISTLGNRIARFLFGLPIRDCTNGFRAVKLEFLSKMTLTEPGFAVLMEELYYAKFLARSFCEIPYTLTNRSNEHRASNFSFGPQVFYRYLKYALKSFFRLTPKSLQTVDALLEK